MLDELLEDAEGVAAQRLPAALVGLPITRRTRTRPCRYWKWRLITRPHNRCRRMLNTPCRACTSCAEVGYATHIGGQLWLSKT